SDVSRRDLESIHTEVINKISTLLVEWCREKLDSDPVGFFVQGLERVQRELKLLEQFLKIRLILRVLQCCRACRSQPVRTKGLKLNRVCTGQLCGKNKRKSPFFVSTMVEACFRNHIDPLGIIS